MTEAAEGTFCFMEFQSTMQLRYQLGGYLAGGYRQWLPEMFYRIA